jgi:hypothetical protein
MIRLAASGVIGVAQLGGWPLKEKRRFRQSWQLLLRPAHALGVERHH